MDRFTSLEVLVAIVDHGGFGRAAQRLGISPTMVSAHLARLEDRLGTRLIHRSTRRFALTTEGHRFVEESRAILEALRSAEANARRGSGGPSGRVAINVPSAIGLRFVVPAIPLFRTLHPQVAFDLSLADHTPALHPEGHDLVIRTGVAREGRDEVLTLGQTRFVQVASPEYLERRGIPANLAQLEEHDCILYATAERPLGQWRFQRGAERRSLRPGSVLTFNHGSALGEAALAGLGIAQTLELLVARELADGRLVRVLPEWNTEPVDLQLFITEDRRKREAVGAAARFLRERVDWSGLGGAPAGAEPLPRPHRAVAG